MSELTTAHLLADLYDELGQELKSQLDMLLVVPATHNVVVTYLTSDLNSIRFTTLVDQMAISDLWKNIRSNEAILDLILDLTVSLHHLVGYRLEKDWDTFIQETATSIAVFRNKDVEEEVSTLQDDAEMDRYVTPADLLRFMKSNPWLVTLFIIRRLPVYRELMRQYTAQATARAAG